MTPPKIQLALDTVLIEDALRIAEDLHGYWDILEIGTSLLLQEGLRSVAIFRERFPDAVLLADTKIVDSGTLLTEIALRAGADIISVVSAAAEHTIEDCIEVSHAHGKQILLDHLSIDWISPDLIKKSAYGADIVGLHIPKDIQGKARGKKDAIIAIKDNVGAAISIAGGVNPELVSTLSEYPVDIFVVGGYLLNATDTKNNAQLLKEAMRK